MNVSTADPMVIDDTPVAPGNILWVARDSRVTRYRVTETHYDPETTWPWSYVLVPEPECA